MPSASSASAAAKASCSSEPVPIEMSSGVPPVASRRMYPPRATPSVPARRPGQGRELLARQRQRDRPVAPLERQRPRSGRLVRVARSDEPQVRDRPQRRVVLDRLVGRAVLAEAHRVVGPDVDDRQAGQRREADGSAHVVAEGQERGDVRDGSRRGRRSRSRCRPCACSRTPNRRFRPAVSALKSVSPLTSVRFDSDRSAAPPNSSGTRPRRAWIASWLALRVATSDPVSYVLRSASQPVGAARPASRRRNSAARPGPPRRTPPSAPPSRRRAPRRPGSPPGSGPPPRPGRRTSDPDPSRRPPWSGGPRPGRAARRAPSASPACSGCRSRCASGPRSGSAGRPRGRPRSPP